MSVAEILTALHTLTPVDLRIVRRELTIIAAKSYEIASCDAAALEGAQMLDGMEAEDGAR